jgi:hypothetical protein
MWVRTSDGRGYTFPHDDLIRLMPSASGARRYDYAAQRCGIAILMTRDFSRVFIGGGEWGFEGIVREVDPVELHALAARFKLPELEAAAAVHPIPEASRLA